MLVEPAVDEGQQVALGVLGVKLPYELCRQFLRLPFVEASTRRQALQAAVLDVLDDQRPLVRWQMERRPHLEYGYRACLGQRRLAREYGNDRLEAACVRMRSIRAPHYRSVKSILACGLDRQSTDPQGGDRNPAAPMPSHANVRGAGYYGYH